MISFSFRYLVQACLTSAIALPLSAQVPAPYQDLYTSLNSQLSTFSESVHTVWNGVPYPTLYSSQLNTANSENGSLLLAPAHYANVLTQMDQLQALGVKALTVHINFPVLYSPYYGANQSQYQQYLSFYTQVASDVRLRGLKLIVETQVAKSSDPSMNSWLKGLTWSSYQAGRAQNAAVVAQSLRPDYMVVITEPDTEAAASGQSAAGTIPGSVQLLTSILGALKGTGVAAGAGAGTWLPNFTGFLKAYAGTPVQFLDMHIYPVNRNFLANALAGADIAHAAGKPVTMTEAWLYKLRDSELGASQPNQYFSRDVFSFWAPLDAEFLQVVHDLASYKQFAMISPFWSQYFFTYLNYSQNSTMSPSQLSTQAVVQASQANGIGAFTTTGLAYETAVLPAPDHTVPQVPIPPATLLVLGGVKLTWKATTDNVGVAGYRVFRNGLGVAITSDLFYSDRTATAGMTYSYTISAFDAAGNSSPISAASIVTPKK